MPQTFEQFVQSNQASLSARASSGQKVNSPAAQSEISQLKLTNDALLLNAISTAGSRLSIGDNFNIGTAGVVRTSTTLSKGGVGTHYPANSHHHAASTGHSANGNFYSETEAAILRANVPIELNEAEEITVNGQRGILVNKNEISNWRGIPLAQYQINDDPQPEVIRKRTDQKIVYQQEVAIRYLRPPTPPSPGEILIQKEADIISPPAPPLVIRQQPPRPITPPPLVIREAPPPAPAPVGRKIITISGKRIPPPPRKVIIERLPPMPSKPQSVIIERWLPYKQVKRKVIYLRSNEKENSNQTTCKPKNVIIQWEAPKVQIKKEFKDLGVVRANPIEYVERYGTTLKRSMELPTFVKEIRPPAGVKLAADSNNQTVYELEGDLYALNLVDLEREGLIEYRHLLKQLKDSESHSNNGSKRNSIADSYKKRTSSGSSTASSGHTVSEIVADILKLFNCHERNNVISLSEAQSIIARASQRLGRKLTDQEIKEFFQTVDIDVDGNIQQDEFKRVFEKLFN